MSAKRVFTDEQEQFIFDHHRGKSDKEMCELLLETFGQSFKPRQITWFKTSHNLHSFELFPKNIVDYIKENRYGKRHQDLTNEINEKFGTAYTKPQISNYLRDHKLPTGSSRARPELYEEGETFIRKNGQAYIKINGKIVKKDRYVVEQSGIKLSSKDRIRHLDGDPVNCDIDNLKVISDGYETVICGIAYVRIDGHLVRKDRWVLEQNGIMLGPKDLVRHKDGNPLNCEPDNLNVISDGYETVFCGIAYVRIDGHLVRKDRWVLEQLGIFLERGQCVKHLDGDPANCEPSNLSIISQKENMVLNYNRWNTTNPQLNQCAIDTVRLQFAITEAMRKRNVKH